MTLTEPLWLWWLLMVVEPYVNAFWPLMSG
jgi:hypothetical protein